MSTVIKISKNGKISFYKNIINNSIGTVEKEENAFILDGTERAEKVAKLVRGMLPGSIVECKNMDDE